MAAYASAMEVSIKVGVITKTSHTNATIERPTFTVDEKRSNIQVGPIARSYWDITHARQPGGTEPSQPTSATFRQMQHLDSKLSEPQSTGAEPEFRVVTEIRALVG
ncbi:hypothetical protein F444_01379, partial [Phytophthora nicotianae P1976]